MNPLPLRNTVSLRRRHHKPPQDIAKRWKQGHKGPYGLSGYFGSGGIPGACTASPDGKAFDPVASIFGCPDCPGMAALKQSNPTYYKICYNLKRTTGKVVLLGGAALVLYLMLKD